MKLKVNNKKNIKRAEYILRLYKSGSTLSEIGDVFSFSRSRAQQIVIKEMKKDILKRLGIEKLNRDEQVLLDVAAKEEIQEIAENRKMNKKTSEEQEFVARVNDKMKGLPDYHIFSTVSEYTRALNENIILFKKYFPDIAKAIIQKQKKMWSRHYIKCRICSTTSVRHMSHGLCENCYYKSDIFKEMQSASRIRNIDKWREKQNKYSKQYSQRPEVIARNREREDRKKYGGNREKTIERDNFRCKECGMTREDSQKNLGRDLYVYHIGSTKDNRLENLKTVCQKCHNKNTVKMMHASMQKTKKEVLL